MAGSEVKTGRDFNAKLVLDARAELGEGSIWHPIEQRLYWVDIEGRVLHRYDPVSGVDEQFNVGQRIGTVVPVRQGGLLVALQNGIHKMDLSTSRLTLLNNPLTDPDFRFNDGKCDPSGRFWVGTLALDFRDHAAVLYRFDGDKSIRTMLEGVSISNGIVWTSDRKTMYYNDTPTLTVQAFDYDDESGEISNRRVAIRLPEGGGFPDGMTIDINDKLWIALWGGSAVACYDPVTGTLLEKISLPAPHVSSCAFGGSDLATLYITTARQGLKPDQLKQFPLSGGLFEVRPGVKGVSAYFYSEQPNS